MNPSQVISKNDKIRIYELSACIRFLGSTVFAFGVPFLDFHKGVELERDKHIHTYVHIKRDTHISAGTQHYSIPL